MAPQFTPASKPKMSPFTTTTAGMSGRKWIMNMATRAFLIENIPEEQVSGIVSMSDRHMDNIILCDFKHADGMHPSCQALMQQQESYAQTTIADHHGDHSNAERLNVWFGEATPYEETDFDKVLQMGESEHLGSWTRDFQPLWQRLRLFAL